MKDRSNWINQYKHKLQGHLRVVILNQMKLDPVVVSLRKKRTKIPVIIQCCKNMEKSVISALRDNNIAAKIDLPMIRAVAASAEINAIRKLCACRSVKKIFLDHQVRGNLNIATPAVGSASVRSNLRLSGRRVSIAILDTGVFPHPDLVKPTNRILAFRDLINGRRRPYDDNGHGTHVAGCALGNGYSSQGRYRGTATGGNLVAVKVLNRNGTGRASTVIQGLQWVIRNRSRYRIRIINLSLGSSGFIDCAEDPVCLATSKAWRQGIVVCTAAGNSGLRSRTIDSPGINPLVITVGATNDRNTVRLSDDIVAHFSSRGPISRRRIKPDLMAPGTNITSLRAPAIRTRGSSFVSRNYISLSGTSMSTPIVAGAIAQILQRSPRLGPFQVKSLLMRNAFKLRLFSSNAQGSGVLNLRFLLR